MSLDAEKTSASRSNDADFLCASPRLFENPLLDKLSRVHWSTPLVAYTPFVLLLGYLSLKSYNLTFVLGAALAGYFVWTLIEYFGHRFVFHAEFPGAFGARLHFLIHGVHHVHPNDPLRLVMPVLLSGPIMLIALLVTWLVFGFPLGYPLLMGFIIGYVCYDLVHYYTHYGNPKTWLGLTLRRMHMMHHFRDSTRAFGISAPYWDYVFKTQYIGPQAESH
jgi:sterol desaturase/sphingolipid hydroxylase (fatty acid hydroxylase superfamily)